LLWRGVPWTCLTALERGRGRLLLTRPIHDEVVRVLAEERFGSRIQQSGRSPVEHGIALVRIAEFVNPSSDLIDIRDPDDLKVIQAAIGGGADLIVTNDTDLLVLESVGPIAIVRPVDLLHTLGVHLPD
jgi:putative PIN family toxin of toxin-antitoxin system